MTRRTPILGYVTLFAFAVTLAVWPLSYLYGCYLQFGHHGLDIRGGGYYLVAFEERTFPMKAGTQLTRFDGFYTEFIVKARPQRWKPVRPFPDPGGYLFSFVVVVAWAPPLLLAAPAWWVWRRRRGGGGGRGFEVRQPTP